MLQIGYSVIHLLIEIGCLALSKDKTQFTIGSRGNNIFTTL